MIDDGAGRVNMVNTGRVWSTVSSRASSPAAAALTANNYILPVSSCFACYKFFRPETILTTLLIISAR